MAISYSAPTNTITVTAGTEGTPINFTDIYNADVAGGWGVVSRQCTDQYCFDCKMVIGDGSTATWVADTLKQIVFTSAVITGTGQKIIDVLANANFRLGVCSNATDKTTEDGCQLKYQGLNTPHFIFSVIPVELYSCTFAADDRAMIKTPSGSKFYNTLFTKGIYLDGAVGVFYNTHFQNSIYAMNNPIIEVGSEEISIEHIRFGIFIQTATILRNARIKNSITADTRLFGSVASHYFINVDCSWTISWNFSTTAILYRQYEIDLKVIDKDNTPINLATVKIWDKDSNLIVDTTTDVNGVIATQTITRGYYNQANGNTLQEASPHLIKIEKAGLTTYEADFTLDAKKDWLVALQVGGGGVASKNINLSKRCRIK